MKTNGTQIDELSIKLLNLESELALLHAKIEAQNKEIERIINLHTQMLDIIKIFSADDKDTAKK